MTDQLDLDALLPNPDVATAHERVVAAPPDRVRAAVNSVDLAGDPVVGALLRARGIRGRTARLSDFRRLGFTVLVDDASALVLGIRGRFWTPGGDLRRIDTLEDVPGTSTGIWSFEVRPHPDGSLVRTETRVRCADDAARRRFRAYWTVVGPFSGFIRRRMLEMIEVAATAPGLDSAEAL